MIQFIGQMMKLPLTTFVAGAEIVLKTAQEMQKMIDQEMHTTLDSITPTRGLMPESEARDPDRTMDCGADQDGANNNYQTPQQEESKMADQDLSGKDELKYVSYSILFTKRDEEKTLIADKHDIVDYATDGESYGGLRIADFAVEDTDNEWSNIKEEDRKYIKFVYQVDARLPKSDKDYDREKTAALQQIAVNTKKP